MFPALVAGARDAQGDDRRLRAVLSLLARRDTDCPIAPRSLERPTAQANPQPAACPWREPSVHPARESSLGPKPRVDRVEGEPSAAAEGDRQRAGQTQPNQPAAGDASAEADVRRLPHSSDLLVLAVIDDARLIILEVKKCTISTRPTEDVFGDSVPSTDDVEIIIAGRKSRRQRSPPIAGDPCPSGRCQYRRSAHRSRRVRTVG